AVEEWRYQAKLTLVVRRSGARNGGGAIASLGLHPYDRPGHVFALTDCHVADFRLMALWRDVRAHLDLLPPGLSRLTLRLDREGRRHVVAESQSAWDTAEALRAALPDGPQVTCWVQAPEQPPRLVA